MTQAQEQESQAPAPEPLERGRYAVYGMPDGGLLIPRTSGICQRCADCGCGEQQEPIGPIPGGLISMAKAAAAGKMKIPAAMRKMMTGGR